MAICRACESTQICETCARRDFYMCYRCGAEADSGGGFGIEGDPSSWVKWWTCRRCEAQVSPERQTEEATQLERFKKGLFGGRLEWQWKDEGQEERRAADIEALRNRVAELVAELRHAKEELDRTGHDARSWTERAQRAEREMAWRQKEQHDEREARFRAICHKFRTFAHYASETYLRDFVRLNRRKVLEDRAAILAEDARLHKDEEVVRRLKREAPDIYTRATFFMRALALAEELAVKPSSPPLSPPRPAPTDEERRRGIVQAKRARAQDEVEVAKAKAKDVVAAEEAIPKDVPASHRGRYVTQLRSKIERAYDEEGREDHGDVEIH